MNDDPCPCEVKDKTRYHEPGDITCLNARACRKQNIACFSYYAWCITGDGRKKEVRDRLKANTEKNPEMDLYHPEPKWAQACGLR